jgi:pimeloyl-ACP methyl ester carboxylesterase
VLDSLTALGRNPDFVRHGAPLPYQERLEAVRAKVRLVRTSWIGSWISEWAQDALVVIDRIAARALPPSARSLAAAIDTEAVGVVGMSYGGAVATRLSYLDDRARACINLDGTNWTWDVVGQSIPTPLLALHSDATYFKPVFSALGIDVGEAFDQLTVETPLHSDLDYEPHASLGLREDVYRWSLRGITHLGLTDHLFLEKGTTPIPVGVGPLAGVAGAALINRICRSFLDTYLRGKGERFPAELLDHTSIVQREMSSLRLQALNNRHCTLFEREA